MTTPTYSPIIREETRRALWNIRNVLDASPDALWEKAYCGMPLWKHIYHTLHSLDQWYINPPEYEKRGMHPAFHIPDLNNLDIPSAITLSREQLNGYIADIEVKISAYTNSLNDSILLEYPEGCRYTRFQLILGQHRHLAAHMGMIMGFIITETGLWPRVYGLEGELPQGEYSLYF